MDNHMQTAMTLIRLCAMGVLADLSLEWARACKTVGNAVPRTS